MRLICSIAFLLLATFFVLSAASRAQQSSSAPAPIPTEGDYTAHDFHFKSGETLPQLRLHYLTFGRPQKDASGKVTNAVLVLHGTGGSGRQFLSPQFANVLFGP